MITFTHITADMGIYVADSTILEMHRDKFGFQIIFAAPKMQQENHFMPFVKPPVVEFTTKSWIEAKAKFLQLEKHWNMVKEAGYWIPISK